MMMVGAAFGLKRWLLVYSYDLGCLGWIVRGGAGGGEKNEEKRDKGKKYEIHGGTEDEDEVQVCDYSGRS